MWNLRGMVNRQGCDDSSEEGPGGTGGLWGVILQELAFAQDLPECKGFGGMGRSGQGI